MLVFFPTQDMVDFYTKFLEIVLWGQDDSAEDAPEDDLNMNADAAELMQAHSMGMDSGGRKGRKIAGLDTTIKVIVPKCNVADCNYLLRFRFRLLASSGSVSGSVSKA
jgi:hypothetical protein